MAITSDEQVLNTCADFTQWTLQSGFDAAQQNDSNDDTQIYREGGSCCDWVMKSGITNGYSGTANIPATVNWTDSLMKVCVFWRWIAGDQDLAKLSGGHNLRLSSSTGFTTNYRQWAINPQISGPDRYGWTPIRVFNQNPDATAGTINSATIESIGWVATTGGTGTKLTGFDHAILISKMIAHSQTVTLANLRTTDDTNDYGVVENFGPDFYKLNISVELGLAAATADTLFSVSNKSIFFDNIEPGHNLGWIFVDSGADALDFILNGVVVTWNQQDSSITQAQVFTNATVCDIFRVSNSSFARGGRVTLAGYVSDANTFFTDNILNACDRIDAGDFLFSRNTVLGSLLTSTEGAMLIDASFTTAVAARQTDNAFTRGTAGHALELASGTPASFTLAGYKYTGYNATTGSNLVANSGPTDAAIYNNSGGAVTITISGGGDTPSVRNGAGATTTIIAATSVTLTGLRDNTEIRVLDNATGAFLAGTENATTGTADNRSFEFSLAAALTVDIAVFNVAYILPPNNRIENFVIPATDASIPLAQVRDRNYKNPL